MHVVTGPPDPAQPTRAEREAYTAEAVDRAAELRKAGDIEGAKAVRLRMPDRPSDRSWPRGRRSSPRPCSATTRSAPPWRRSRQRRTTPPTSATCCSSSEAFWRLDVVPQIDEMVRQRIPTAEYERYMRDPERPAFLRPSASMRSAAARSPTCSTRSPRLRWPGSAASPQVSTENGKIGAPRRGARRRDGLSAPPREPSAEITAAGSMMDTRQAELGRQLAARPPQWALERWGDAAGARPGALLADWQRRAGIVGAYREAAGITDPRRRRSARPPSGKARQAGRRSASVRGALQLPDEAALLKAMGQGELEARRGRVRPRGCHGARPTSRPRSGAPGRGPRTPRPARHIAAGAGMPRLRPRRQAPGRRARRGTGPARRRRRGPAGVDRGERRAGRPRREAAERELRAPGPSRADPGHGRRGGRGLGAEPRRRRRWTRPRRPG